MSEQKKYGIQKRLPRLELSNKPTLIITEKLKKQIDYLHNKVGTKEWSGELITREEGSITDLDNWKVIAEDIFLVDIGTSTYTSYEVDKAGFKSADIIQMYDAFPGMIDGTHKNQHLHTHHSMGAFFSGTDWENLEERGVLHNYFIMLIVNFKGEYVAKCAFKGKRKINAGPTIEFANNTDGFTPFTLTTQEKEEEVLVVMDMKIEYPVINHMIPLDEDVRVVMRELSVAEQAEEKHLDILLQYLNNAVKNKIYLVDEAFRLRYESVVKAIEEESKKKTVSLPLSGNNYNGYKQGNMFNQGDDYGYGGYWDDREWDYDNRCRKKEEKHVQGKRIGEMTDQEFRQYEQSMTSKIEWKTEHAKIVLNAAISGNRFSDKISSPINELKKLDKKLKSKSKKEEWIINFQQEIGTAVYDMWTNDVETEDAYCLLEMCLKILEDHKINSFINDVYEAIEHEMDFMKEEINYYSSYKEGGVI
jgi:hypothetical protein